jgi:hypothetical protein
VLRARGPRALADAGVSWERLSGWLLGGMDAEAWESVIPSMGRDGACDRGRPQRGVAVLNQHDGLQHISRRGGVLEIPRPDLIAGQEILLQPIHLPRSFDLCAEGVPHAETVENERIR